MIQKKCILVVDDEFNVVNMLRINLEAEGYEVITAYNGEEGLSTIKTQSPDLVLCDVTMPCMDGLEFCRLVRERRDLGAIPFIFLSAKSDMPQKIDGFQAGADDYITKPFHIAELVARIHAMLARVDRIRSDSQDVFVSATRDLNRLSALGILATSIAHEVRNQLTAVVSNAELMKLSKNETERAQYSDEVFGHIERIDHTVYSMLDFARRRDVKHESQQISKIVQEALLITQPRLSSQDVTVAVSVPDVLPPVLADRQQICQVLVNLVINASQAFTGEGHIDIAAISEGDTVALRVSDNGCGIPASALPALFEPFRTTRQASGGIGLGLYICKEIVEAHGGRIEVQSEEGAGTQFTLRLPVASL